MRTERSRQEFRMKLGSHEKRMVLKLDDLNQLAVRRKPARNKTSRFQIATVRRIAFITMAMPLHDGWLTVNLSSQRAGTQVAGIGADAHRSPIILVLHPFLLLVHEMNDRMSSVLIDLRCVRIFPAEDVARVFDRG